MDSDNEAEEFKKKLEALKPKTKKLDAAEGLLNEKSYEGKLLAVQVIAERELKRTVLLFKGMIARGFEDEVRMKAEEQRARRDAEEKAAREKAAKLAAEKKSKKSLFGRKK
jgi:hypothetical protein